MKTTLIILWSIAGLPFQQNCTVCQGGPAGAGTNAMGASATAGGTMSGPSGGMNINGAYGLSDGSMSAAGYDEFNSPCRSCSKGRCCKDSTCNMYQHYPYRPDNHGYYYFRSYNYTHVWQHQQWTATIGGDPRNPYSRAMFIPVYEQFENTTYEPDSKPSNTLAPLPHVSKQLPDLEKLVKLPEGDMPIESPTEPKAPTPAPENN